MFHPGKRGPPSKPSFWLSTLALFRLHICYDNIGTNMLNFLKKKNINNIYYKIISICKVIDRNVFSGEINTNNIILIK